MSLAPYQQTNGAAVAVPDQVSQVSAVAALVEWAHGAQAAHEVAVNLVDTSFCPQHYRGKPQEATAAILAGLEVGLQPMAALQAFVPIQGSAAAKAITLRAIVQSRGHDIWIEESSATRAVVAGRRKGSAQVQRSVWTIERAGQMKLTGRDQWKVQPTAMLVARATAECARMVASDAILGIPYAVEELEDGGPVQATAVQASAVERSVRRRNPVSTLPPPAVEPEPAAAVEDEQPGPGEGRIDPKGDQMKRLHILLGEVGVTDRDEALRVVSDLAMREVGSTKDLTYREAALVIDRLVAVRDAKRVEQAPAAEGGES